jgi:hypothetical protein
MQNDRQLSQEQLKYIFDFCRKWDVVYVDLRLELVDHIATSISEIWQSEPELPFQKAFHRVYKSFGIFGLLSIVESHRKIVWKRYWRQIKRSFASWLSPPRVFASLLVWFALYHLLVQQPHFQKGLIVFALIGLVLTGGYLGMRSYQLSKKIKGEKTMLLSTPSQFLWVSYFLYYLPFQGFYQTYFWKDTSPDFFLQPLGCGILSGILVVTLLFLVANIKLLRLAAHQIGEIQKQLIGFI